jgi:hypothetical protein
VKEKLVLRDGFGRGAKIESRMREGIFGKLNKGETQPLGTISLMSENGGLQSQ